MSNTPIHNNIGGVSPFGHIPFFPGLNQGGLPEQDLTDAAVEEILANREEIIRAFIAKYGFGPGEAIQVVHLGPDGSINFSVTKRSSISKDVARDRIQTAVERLDEIGDVQSFGDTYPGILDSEKAGEHARTAVREVQTNLLELVEELGG